MCIRNVIFLIVRLNTNNLLKALFAFKQTSKSLSIYVKSKYFSC